MSAEELTVGEFLNNYYTKRTFNGDLFGVEVEMEVENSSMPGQASGWDLKEDGSLKKINDTDQTGEWVLKEPMPAELAKERVKYLDDLLRRKDTKIRDTIRAGVHIHVNVADLTFRQLFNFLTIYYSLEDLLLDFCGNGRKGNAFARPFSCCEYTIDCYARFLNGDRSALGSENIRYSALNTNPLYKYGTLEFRAIRTPSTGLCVINEWIDLFAYIKDACKTFESPAAILSLVSGYEASMFVNRFVEPNFADKYINDLPSAYITECVFNSIRIWQEIAYSKSDWKDVVKQSKGPSYIKKNFYSPGEVVNTSSSSMYILNTLNPAQNSMFEEIFTNNPQDTE